VTDKQVVIHTMYADNDITSDVGIETVVYVAIPVDETDHACYAHMDKTHVEAWADRMDYVIVDHEDIFEYAKGRWRRR
jgi:hypothetical protein